MDGLLNTAENVYKRLQVSTTEPYLQYLMFMPKQIKQVAKNIFSRHLKIFAGLLCFCKDRNTFICFLRKRNFSSSFSSPDSFLV